MSDTPNEIWCDTGLYYDYKTDWSEGSWRTNDDCGGVKYVRADRIEKLDKACKDWAEVSQRNYQRAMTAETKLRSAWCALEDIRRFSGCGDSRRKAEEALAKLKGEDRG